jgi:hypothetical protein
MISIRNEIERVASGEWDAEDNPLKNAPHTIEELGADDWPHAYSREQAVFRLAGQGPRLSKFFAPVGPRRQRLRRPQPGLLLPADGRLARGWLNPV